MGVRYDFGRMGRHSVVIPQRPAGTTRPAWSYRTATTRGQPPALAPAGARPPAATAYFCREGRHRPDGRRGHTPRHGSPTTNTELPSGHLIWKFPPPATATNS